jgi:hypothetical protein
MERSLPPRTRRLTHVGAYFRGDKPGGLGFIVQPSPDVPGDFLLLTIETMLADYDAAPADPRDLIGQLEELGRLGIEALNDNENALIALVNICWLELRGHLETDEHNGIVWVTQRDDIDAGGRGGA